MKLEEEKGEVLIEYKIDIILAETQKSYYGIIDGVTVEPKWIPKRVVGKDFRIENWYVKLIKEGKTEWEHKEKKMKQVKLTNFVTIFEDQTDFLPIDFFFFLLKIISNNTH